MLLYCKGGNSLAASRTRAHIVLLLLVLPWKSFGWGAPGMESGRGGTFWGCWCPLAGGRGCPDMCGLSVPIAAAVRGGFPGDPAPRACKI